MSTRVCCPLSWLVSKGAIAGRGAKKGGGAPTTSTETGPKLALVSRACLHIFLNAVASLVNKNAKVSYSYIP